MAVDTKAKRLSMLNFWDGTTIHLLFEADGAVDLDDRQHLLDCYSGIAFGAPAVVVSFAERIRLGYHEVAGLSGEPNLGGR